MLARRLFIAVNNPWLCSVNDDPVRICRDMDYILSEQELTDRFGLRSEFKADGTHGLFPMYRIEVHLEAVGTTTAIDLGVITGAEVSDMYLHLTVRSSDMTYHLDLPTDCEDLSAKEYRLKRKDFETRNVLTYESDC